MTSLECHSETPKLNMETHKWLSPSDVLLETKTSANPLTFSSSINLTSSFLVDCTSWPVFLTKSPSMTVALTVRPLPALSWETSENILRYFGRSALKLTNMRICGRQFLVCGGASSSLSKLYLAADKAKPRIPSPHSFSALR